MPKKISPRERLIGFAMNATESELQDALETLRAISAARFPKGKKTATGRKSAKQPVATMGLAEVEKALAASD